MRIDPMKIVLFCAAALFAAAPPAHALRVATWNLMEYDPSNGGLTPRQPYFRTVIASLLPDIVISQETNTAAAKDSFLTNVLNVVDPGQWTGQWMNVNSGEGMGVYWKPAQCAISGIAAFATRGPRLVVSCLVKPAGYKTNPGWFRLYSFHPKAGGPGTADSTTRRLECTDIRSTINSVSQTVMGPNFLLGGDSNFYGAWEGGYIRLTEDQDPINNGPNNNGRSKDFLNLPGTWHDYSPYKLYHTQSPCLTCPTVPGINYSNGGMDDRFDMLLSAYSVQDGQGLEMLSLDAFGNDGSHYNVSINADNYNGAVGLTVANALYNASDHLPAVSVIRLPAKLSAASQLAFGTVIAGATAELPLSVSNIAPQPVGYTWSSSGASPLTLPGDTLRYSLSPPTDFTAPPGNLIQLAGALATDQTIGMSTASAGEKGGTLTVATNDPDTLSKSVLLSGKVLRHASASLNSLATVLADTLDFGEQLVGAFPDTSLGIFNLGCDGLQAQLAVNAGVISGGDGHFSIVGGFSSALVGGTPASYGVHFDAAGVVFDSTYEATLTFSSADEVLPGTQPQPDLVVTLRARATYEGAGVPTGLPTVLRFYPPHPNPAAGAIGFAYDLPKAAPVRLEVYDLSGRRVANVLSGQVEAGHHELRWNPRESGGGIAAGLYFARFSVPGMTRKVRLVLLP
jgi:hypothetical protein